MRWASERNAADLVGNRFFRRSSDFFEHPIICFQVMQCVVGILLL